MAREAIAGYLESLRKGGLPIPPGRAIKLKPVKQKLKVSLDAA